MKKVTKQILLKCGIMAHMNGFLYLGEAVELAVENKSWLSGITKRLYPEIAKSNGVKPNNVERAIRHAIEKSFDNLTPSQIFEIFKNSIDLRRGKPTNAQFIATVAELYGDGIRAGA